MREDATVESIGMEPKEGVLARRGTPPRMLASAEPSL
jgi:hypothetical protein